MSILYKSAPATLVFAALGLVAACKGNDVSDDKSTKGSADANATRESAGDLEAEVDPANKAIND